MSHAHITCVLSLTIVARTHFAVITLSPSGLSWADVICPMKLGSLYPNREDIRVTKYPFIDLKKTMNS